MIYLPMLEETGHLPSMKYVFAPEIFETRASGSPRQYGLYDNALLSTEVTGVTVGRRRVSRWIVTTDRGDEFRARFVAMGTGPLHRPKLPGIPGIETFAGHYVPHQPVGLRVHRRRPVEPDDRARGQAGSASSVPARPRCSASRRSDATPASCSCSSARRRRSTSANNHMIDPEWFETLAPGWQREWLFNFATLQTGGFADEDLVQDGWTDIAQRIRDRVLANAAERRRCSTSTRSSAPTRRATTRRWRRSGPASTASSTTRRRRPRSSRGTASSASDRASTTSTCRRSTGRTCTSWTPTAGRRRGSTRPACGSGDEHSSSTASSSPRGSRWGPSTPGAPATRRPGATG